MANEDDVLPPEVAAEVAKLRGEGETAEPAPIEQVEVEAVEERPKSRRQQAEEERAAQLRAAEERAAKAEEIANATRRELAEGMGRVQALLEQRQQQYYQPPTEARQEAPAKDWRERRDKAMKKAEAALAEGKLSDYHENLTKAMRIENDARFGPRIEEVSQRAQQSQQPQVQIPSWVPAVESSFSDVLINPQGRAMAITFAQIEMAKQPGTAFNAQVLQKGFERARQELGTKQAAAEPSERARQLLSGSPANGGGGSARPVASNGKQKVTLVKGWEDIARRAGMTKEQYIRAEQNFRSGK